MRTLCCVDIVWAAVRLLLAVGRTPEASTTGDCISGQFFFQTQETEPLSMSSKIDINVLPPGQHVEPSVDEWQYNVVGLLDGHSA